MAEDLDRWSELCKRAERETDFDKRLALIQEIEAFLKSRQMPAEPPTAQPAIPPDDKSLKANG